MKRFIVCFLVLLVLRPLAGQEVSDYDQQITAIRQLLESERFSAALVQAEALIQSGQEALLTSVEAEANLLAARAIIDDPTTDGRQQVRGIRYLQRAARLFAARRDAEAVDRVLAELSDLLGEPISLADLREDGSRKRRRLRQSDGLRVDQELQNALIDQQEATIAALTDSQYQQVLELQKRNAQLDSFEIISLEDSLLVARQNRRIDAQRAELDQRRQQRNFFILLAAAALVILAALYWRFLVSRRYQRLLTEKNESIRRAKERSDELLRNILPASVAAELKQHGKARAVRHAAVSVVFVDFKGFSELANRLEPDAIVQLLDEAFRQFDGICRTHGLEKIKTIGDAYMCAAGLPQDQDDHAQRAVEAALDMQTLLVNHPYFSARIGIHSGPVVAGVVGMDKFAYDIWGDTVNRAARLEVSGEVGEVNISLTTRDMLPAEAYEFTARGSVAVKNLGEIEMYFVRRRVRSEP